jgi:hypothetical protein
MLRIGDYVIDRVTQITEHDGGVQFELLSGTVCTFPGSDPRMNDLVRLARFCAGFETPVVFRIVAGQVVATALYLYRPVNRVDRRGDDVVRVWVAGRAGPCRLSIPSVEATHQSGLLTRSARTKRKLFFLLQGSRIDAVTELTDEQLRALREPGARL